MDLRIAHRQAGLTTLQCGVELESYFTLGAHFEAVYLEEEKALYLTKCERGKGRCHEPGTTYGKAGYTRAICFTALPKHIPAFSIKEVEFTIDDDLLVWKRPPIWALGWPTRGMTNDFDRSRDVVIDGMVARLRSAKRNMVDPRKVTEAVPDWAKQSLHRGEWMRLVNTYFPRVGV